MIRILSVFGTRPEAIKMAPVIKELERQQETFESVSCVTAQHRQMLDQVTSLFGILPDIDLNIMEQNQSLASLSARAVSALSDVVEKVQPDWLLVQGDTTTAMVAALAGFYQQVPVGHIEAGRRTGSRYSPFPEEMNRRLISQLATYHFCPTETAVHALRQEGVGEDCIFLTGNTVIDALHWVISKSPSEACRRIFGELGISPDGKMAKDGRLLLVTAHRRDNFGTPLENICRALREIARRNPDVHIVYPVHLNPNVQKPSFGILQDESRVCLLKPLDYETFAHLMKVSFLVLTDSGGVQEEAPSLGKPVLVLRQETERPEAVISGTVKVIGTECENIVRETQNLLSDRDTYARMARAVNPYGDGRASQRIVARLQILPG